MLSARGRRRLASGFVVLIATGARPIWSGPQTEPIPRLEANSICRAIAVRLQFDSRYQVRLLSARVIRRCPPERVGAPPLLRLRIASAGECAIETINAWHPLWSFDFDQDGEKMRLQPSGEGRVIIPFYPLARTLSIEDIPGARHLITVDLGAAVRAYCQSNAQDLACQPWRLASLQPFRIFSLELLQGRIAAGQDLTPVLRAKACNVGRGTATAPSGPDVSTMGVELLPITAGTVTTVASGGPKPAASPSPSPSPSISIGPPGTVSPGSTVGVALRPTVLAVPKRLQALEVLQPLRFQKTSLNSGTSETIKVAARVPKDAPPGYYCVRLTQNGSPQTECVPVVVDKAGP